MSTVDDVLREMFAWGADAAAEMMASKTAKWDDYVTRFMDHFGYSGSKFYIENTVRGLMEGPILDDYVNHRRFEDGRGVINNTIMDMLGDLQRDYLDGTMGDDDEEGWVKVREYRKELAEENPDTRQIAELIASQSEKQLKAPPRKVGGDGWTVKKSR